MPGLREEELTILANVLLELATVSGKVARAEAKVNESTRIYI
jgi:hypothetical protein